MDHVEHRVSDVAGEGVLMETPVFPLLSIQHLIPLLAVLVWIVEYRRRSLPSSCDIAQRLCRQLIPEMMSLTLLSGFVVVLLACCRDDHRLEDDESWREVKKEWPLLMTADTLIGLQAMLRIVFLVSASFRCARLSPLDGEPAGFFLLAALVRITLLFLSPHDVYGLDGPLGGDMNMALEITAFLLLLPLGLSVFRTGVWRIMGFQIAVGVLASAAMFNHFSLAGSKASHLDALFSMVMLLETAAAVAFYVRSTKVKAYYALEAFSGFAHVFLPFQQALPAYFLAVAFAPAFQVEPSLVGKGYPFELLQAGGLLQIVMYLLAGVVYYMVCAEEKRVSSFAVPVASCDAPPADECVICLGSCESCELCDHRLKPRWRRLQCGHHFHEHCIFEWLKKAQRCPMCRRHVCKDEIAERKGSAADMLMDLQTGAGTAESIPLLDSSAQYLPMEVAQN